jgi:hypothetical protein
MTTILALSIIVIDKIVLNPKAAKCWLLTLIADRMKLFAALYSTEIPSSLARRRIKFP